MCYNSANFLSHLGGSPLSLTIVIALTNFDRNSQHSCKETISKKTQIINLLSISVNWVIETSGLYKSHSKGQYRTVCHQENMLTQCAGAFRVMPTLPRKTTTAAIHFYVPVESLEGVPGPKPHQKKSMSDQCWLPREPPSCSSPTHGDELNVNITKIAEHSLYTCLIILHIIQFKERTKGVPMK
jgi:hypothetical protein